MIAKLKQGLFLVFASILAIVFISLTLKEIDFNQMKLALSEANYFWFLASMALSIVSYWLRATRWNLLLTPMGYNTSVKSRFWAISFAYFMNLTIPRSGEIARATSLYSMEKVPVNKSIGTIILERVIDLLFLGLFFVLTLFFNSKTLFSFFNLRDIESQNYTGHSSYAIYYFILSFITLGLVFFLFRKRIATTNLYKRFINFSAGIWDGFRSILKLENRGKFITYSIGIWVCYFLMTYLVVFAFPATENFSIGQGFFLIVAGALGMILPVTGGLGYPYVMSIAFAAIYITSGQTAEEGKAVGSYFGISLYIAQVISILIFGFIAMFYIAKKKKKNI